MTSSKLVRIYLGAMIAALVAAALYTYSMIDRRQDSLESFSRYNVAYSASQAVIEFQRLQKALLAFAASRTQADLTEAKLRYEILYNRASIAESGRVSQLHQSRPAACGRGGRSSGDDPRPRPGIRRMRASVSTLSRSSRCWRRLSRASSH